MQTLAWGIPARNDLLVPAPHGDRDPPDRAPAIAELCVDACKVGTVSARTHPDDRSGAMVGRQVHVALSAAVGDLVDADLETPAEPSLVEVVCDYPVRHPGRPCPNRDYGRRAIGVFAICWGGKGGAVVEDRGMAGARLRQEHRLGANPALGGSDPAQAILDKPALGRRIGVVSAPHGGRGPSRPPESTPSSPPCGAAAHLGDHAVCGEREVGDPGARERLNDRKHLFTRKPATSALCVRLTLVLVPSFLSKDPRETCPT